MLCWRCVVIAKIEIKNGQGSAKGGQDTRTAMKGFRQSCQLDNKQRIPENTDRELSGARGWQGVGGAEDGEAASNRIDDLLPEGWRSSVARGEFNCICGINLFIPWMLLLLRIRGEGEEV